ncbi:sugar phosphate nucleotidyltransferase [Paenibacillus sp. SYP-B4298]|uniref:sugar phosphate nucleotidyltransferase n=1 Tax=Paenibacillus sp. SYP-B4298 TaxID=2996034 RepID=UPI0022DDC5BE|nr:sugar phosphate nucleotidyltransferase [Paenibacillus sp. SYP-B4298]
MRIVLLSGGSGQRLWPWSSGARTKVFLRLLNDDSGAPQSMLERICNQLEQAGLLQTAAIVTHASQVELTRQHCGEKLAIWSEPHKRGTFHAIALAAASLYTAGAAGDEETVCVLPADMYAEQPFLSLLRQLPDALAQSGAELALIGCSPDHPSTQYGYIVPQQTKTCPAYSRVSRFTEKPDKTSAAALIAEGALWNCGVFAFRLGYMLQLMKERGLPLNPEQLLQRYAKLATLSFDEEVAEHCSHAIVLRYTRAWKDLGSWSALTSEIGQRQIGAGSISAGSPGTWLVNELACPVHVIDVPEIIVAASAAGVLVASRENADRIKQLHPVADAVTWMEEKRWGHMRTLDYSRSASGSECWTRKVSMTPCASTSYHLHRRRHTVWTVVSGRGRFFCQGQQRNVEPGTVLDIPPGMPHGICSGTRALEWIEVQLGERLLEDDKHELARECLEQT